ncbi:hypothetical protein MRX96_018809 [Rhipicephalus microplus]
MCAYQCSSGGHWPEETGRASSAWGLCTQEAAIGSGHAGNATVDKCPFGTLFPRLAFPSPAEKRKSMASPEGLI